MTVQFINKGISSAINAQSPEKTEAQGRCFITKPAIALISAFAVGIFSLYGRSLFSYLSPKTMSEKNCERLNLADFNFPSHCQENIFNTGFAFIDDPATIFYRVYSLYESEEIYKKGMNYLNEGYLHRKTLSECLVNEESKPYFIKALDEFKKGADQCDLSSQIRISKLFKEGFVVPRNKTLASQWLAFISQQKSVSEPAAARLLARSWLIIGQNTKAFDFFLKSAELGDSLSQWEVGKCFENGIGVQKNSEKAFEYYRQAALENGKLKNSLALKLLSINSTEALELFKEADSITAKRNIALMHYKGIGFPKNNEECFRLIKECYEQNRSSVFGSNELVLLRDTLAVMYRRGIGVEANEEKAINLYDSLPIFNRNEIIRPLEVLNAADQNPDILEFDGYEL